MGNSSFAPRNSILRVIMVIMIVMLILCGHASACAGDTYFLIMFASQRPRPNPNYSHSFASFVKFTWDDRRPCVGCLEVHTISWLPKTMILRASALLPEPGQNTDLESSIFLAQQTEQRVSLWGPYEIEPELYERALKQIAVLESGQVRYKMVDSFHRTSRVSNCIHAVGSIAEGYRLRIASPAWGETASHFILRELMPWVIDREKCHYWVSSAMGLDRYPIIYRPFEHPRSGGIQGPLHRLFGTDRNSEATFGPPH